MVTSLLRKVIVVGAGGFLGHAVSCAYVRHGWETYGFVRDEKHVGRLHASEIIPIVGSLDDGSIPPILKAQAQYFNVIVISLDQVHDFLALLESLVRFCRSIADFSKMYSIRPLVLFTSGLKDFGQTGLDGEPGLKPFTEESPLNPPPPASERAHNCHKIFDHGDSFDAVVVRPSNLYGLSGSIYSYFLRVAEDALRHGVLEFAADPRTILHSMHVNDCAEAYVALSQDSIRDGVRQQSFNIAGSCYETLGEIAAALVKAYGITGGVRFRPEAKEQAQGLDYFVFAFSEWASSEKIRALTGWTDKMPSFSEKIQRYRRAYEAAKEQDHPDVLRIEALSKRVIRTT